MTYKKKLIEVALPLKAINEACVKEKTIRQGHPSTLHVYWARRPLAAARAVLFSTLVDDPSGNKELSELEVVKERKRLFHLIEQLVLWKNTNNKDLLLQAKKEIDYSTNNNPPQLLDPFCGAGTIPLEGQKLGLESFGSDLNPLAVLITKGLIELPYKFKDCHPVNPSIKLRTDSNSNWAESTGLANDLRYYGELIKDNCYKILSKFYPKSNNGGKIIGWILARNVECPNPACGKLTPLIKSFVLSSIKNNFASLVPIINDIGVTYRIANNLDNVRKGTMSRQGGRCIFCDNPITFKYIRSEGIKKKIIFTQLATITLKNGRKVFLSSVDSKILQKEIPKVDIHLLEELKGKAAANVPLYGLTAFKDLFTKRQLYMLNTFVDAINNIEGDILEDGGSIEYSKALKLYLAFSFDRLLNQHCTLTRLQEARGSIAGVFSKQAIAMTWDFVEANPFSDSTGNWDGAVNWVAKSLERLSINAKGESQQIDASKAIYNLSKPFVCTDPPYYDNIMYADLSDYFYVWLKLILSHDYPELFKTIQTPKTNEIVASPYIFNGNKDKAEKHFLNGMMSAAEQIAIHANPDYPVTYFYAYKQTETNDEGSTMSTGWETFLQGLITAGYQVTATWPMRTEMKGRTVATNSNALASSIVVTLRKKDISTSIATRSEFIKTLSTELELAIYKMMESDISPVDLQQSSIGPGMAVFTRYTKVLEADGSPMTVRTALRIINAELDRIQEDSDIEMDTDTRFCIQWFDAYGFNEKPYGDAETLSRAKDTSVDGLINAGVFLADRGKAKLRHWSEMPVDWDPRLDKRLTLWECTHQIVRELVNGDGQLGAAKLAKFMGSQKADEAKELAYQLYHICDKRSWAQHAGDYNTLVSNWADIKSQIPNISEGQETLF